jgi:hypothetical protein
MVEDETAYWRVWNRLRKRATNGHVPYVPIEEPESSDPEIQLGQDLAFLLSASQHLPVTEWELRSLESLFDRVTRAYEQAKGRKGKKVKTSDRQAAACRELGLTSTEGRQSEDPRFLFRWLELGALLGRSTERIEDPDRRAAARATKRSEARETMAREFGGDPASVSHRLLEIRKKLKKLLKDQPDSPFAQLWQHYVDALTDPNSVATTARPSWAKSTRAPARKRRTN